MSQTKLAIASSLGSPAHKPLEGSVLPQLLLGLLSKSNELPLIGRCFLSKGPQSALDVNTAPCVPFHLGRCTSHTASQVETSNPDLPWLRLLGPFATMLVP